MDGVVLIIVDFQEKLAPHIEDVEEIVRNSRKLIKALDILDIPVVVTEQIKLGRTIPEISELIDNFKPIEKTSFSCMKNRDFERKLKELNVKSCILIGIETHICILQTAIDLKRAGYEVYVVVDCVGSRRRSDKNVAVMRLISEGVRVTSAESMIYELLETAEHPKFRDILKIVKEN